MSDTVLLTGSTGFIGGAIALELLANSDADLVCLVRPGGEESVQSRLLDSLHAAAEVYGMPLTESQIARCHALPGDITMPSAGVDLAGLTNISECWHAAASLAYKDEQAAEISLHNEHGTKNVVELARNLGCAAFNYVSTAYVAGNRRGIIPETAISETTIPNNHYERSKIASEGVVQDAGFATLRIFRPSIVIGHSQTYGAITFAGLYGFARRLKRARDIAHDALGDVLRHRPLRLLGSANTPINFIPIDYVARAAVKISTETNNSNVYHLANSCPPKLGDFLDALTDLLGMMSPLLVDNFAEFTIIDHKIDDQMEFYRSYMDDEKHFSVSNAEAILGANALRFPLNVDDMAKFADWYLRKQEVPQRA